MKRLKITMILSAISLLTTATVATIPAMALRSDSTGTSTTESTQPADDATMQTVEATAQSADSSETPEPSGKVETLRSRAKQQLEERRAQKSTTSGTVRQKACQAREKVVNKKIHSYGSVAERHLTWLNNTYDKIKTYQTNKQLTAADYGTLISAADAQKTAAAEAVGALQAVSVDIDCSAADPAATLATVKTAVQTARTGLQDYRATIKKVMVALLTAKRSTTETPATTDTNGETAL